VRHVVDVEQVNVAGGIEERDRIGRRWGRLFCGADRFVHVVTPVLDWVYSASWPSFVR